MNNTKKPADILQEFVSLAEKNAFVFEEITVDVADVEEHSDHATLIQKIMAINSIRQLAREAKQVLEVLPHHTGDTDTALRKVA